MTFNQIWEFLKGKKTYIVGAIMVVWSGLHATQYIDADTFEVGVAIFTALGLWTLRHGIENQ